MLTRIVWAVSFGAGVVGAWIAGRLIHMLLWPFFTHKQLRGFTVSATGFIWWLTMVALHPFIRLEALPDSMSWSEAFEGPGQPIFFQNHSSMLDGFIFSAALPMRYAIRVRTLAAGYLFSKPFFGQLLTDCGNFPVNFKSDKLGVFSTDKDAQTKVSERMETFVAEGGCLSLYPEGQVNRGSYKTIQPFRRGSVAVAQKHKLAVYGFLMHGVADAWPGKEPLPCFGATLRYKLFRLDVDATLEVADLAASLEKQMQAEMDKVIAAVEAPSSKKVN